jgi:hypothetical protein
MTKGRLTTGTAADEATETTAQQRVDAVEPTGQPRNVVYCSFCLKPHEQVERLIAGPGQVYICNRCVARCNEILRREGVPI